jgi:hypothetical protein
MLAEVIWVVATQDVLLKPAQQADPKA